jgi:hypothetical protein
MVIQDVNGGGPFPIINMSHSLYVTITNNWNKKKKKYGFHTTYSGITVE